MLRAEQEKQKCKQLTEQNGGDNQHSNNKTDDNNDELSKEIEGLGRILTGTCAMCDQDTVSSTLAHILIMQDRERFVYSHKFTPLLISQLEDCLEGNDLFANCD